MGLLLLLFAASCGKKQDVSESAEGGSAPQPVGDDSPLAYQESVRAGMDNLELRMSFRGEDGEREEWEGRMTMVKDRFATVEHMNSQRKNVHLRRWSNVHIAEIPASGEPRANRTEDSPLTGQLLVVDRLPEGGWKHRLADESALPKEQAAGVEELLGELDSVERAAASFYQDQELKVGESWQVPATSMVRWFGDEVDGFSGDITLVVDRMESLQGQSCVVMKVSLNTVGKMRDPDGYDLRWMSVTALAELTDRGESLIIVALVDGDLHIRIFDANGRVAVDKTESELVSGPDLNTLKALLNEAPFPDASRLSEKAKTDIIEKATSISGHTHPDGQTLDMAMEGVGEIWRAPALGEDLKVDIRGSVTLKTAVEERDIELTISGPLVISEERTLRS